MLLSRRTLFGLVLSFQARGQLPEIELGRTLALEHEKNVVILDSGLLTAYVGRIASRLGAKSERPGLALTTKVVDTESMDAASLPGGFIYVNRGLLDFVQTESELAGVLAHEVGHLASRRGVHPNYTRADEFEADRLGFHTMIRAGWNPEGLLQLMERISRLPGDRSTPDHPSAAERCAAFREEMKQVGNTGSLTGNTLSFRAMKLGLKLLPEVVAR